MRKRLALFAAVALLATVGTAAAQQNGPRKGGAPKQGGRGGRGGRGGAPAPPLKLMSRDITDGGELPQKFTCAAGNAAVSPALQWSQTPRAALTFTLIVHDMEGHPRNGVEDILHWMVWNIPSTANGLPEGVASADYELPDGSYQTNGFVGMGRGGRGGQAGEPQGPNFGYRPPCPPQNVAVPHHYAFELFAVNTKLDLPASATRDDVLKAMDGHVVGHASIVALFHR
jgi:Raf kinase inhibitor-like YbhB/YbcL family protein